MCSHWPARQGDNDQKERERKRDRDIEREREFYVIPETTQNTEGESLRILGEYQCVWKEDAIR